jgi:hypothetical protein
MDIDEQQQQDVERERRTKKRNKKIATSNLNKLPSYAKKHLIVHNQVFTLSKICVFGL